MDIRTKLVFALVAVSLGSMLALAASGYSIAGGLLEDASARQLQALAESKKQDLEKVIRGWQDRVGLIGSRTQLRLSLRDHNESHRESDRDIIQRILDDARASARTMMRLSVYDAHGHPVVSTPNARPDTITPLTSDRIAAVERAVAEAEDDTTPGSEAVYEGLFTGPSQPPQVQFLTALELDGERIGWLEVRLGADELAEVAHNYIGLGETGETLIVARRGSREVRVLHPVRHQADENDVPLRVWPEDPAYRAAMGVDSVFIGDLVDYRGETVWAATRFLPELEWGVVVKFDAAEERGPARELGRRMARLALSLSAFAILAGVLLGFRFARPIHELAEVADRIRTGDTGARADGSSHDEVGQLARTFNQMADALTDPGIRIRPADDERGE
jgi:HAMP domain-containing protein